ncbi:MAG: class II aldolase and adducin N-terminal domain-containing protein [Pseudomonadota bacterium]
MSVEPISRESLTNLPYYEERVDLAAAFRWTARLNMHEAVANHFSLSVNEDGSQFLINPNQRHFSLIKASDILLLDANDPETMNRPGAPDETAWGLHGAVHRNCPHARCALHVHSIHATVLASLAESIIKPIDQNTAIFHNRHVVDENYGGLAFEEEGERCSQLLSNPKIQAMVMGNHGVMIIGNSVSQAFNRLYYFERAAETYIKALWTGQPLRVLSEEIAEKTAQEIEDYDDQSGRHFSDLKEILDRDEPDYRY